MVVVVVVVVVVVDVVVAVVSVTLRMKGNSTFRGFMIRSVLAANENVPVGNFREIPGTKHVCGRVSHTTCVCVSLSVSLSVHIFVLNHCQLFSAALVN